MASKQKSARDPDGIFHDVSAFFIPHGVQSHRHEVRALPHAPPVHTRFVLCAIVLKHLGSTQVGKKKPVQMRGHVQIEDRQGPPWSFGAEPCQTRSYTHMYSIYAHGRLLTSFDLDSRACTYKR
jgi:hypothetical protein